MQSYGKGEWYYEKVEKRQENILVKLIGMLFVILAVPTAVKRSSKGTSVPEETDSGVL